MMDFIMVPLTTGIVFAAIYGLFELFVRRKERLAIIEKISENLDASVFEGKVNLPSYGMARFSFSTLKAGCLLAGVGAGLFIGFLLNWGFMQDAVFYKDNWYTNQLISVVYGSSVLLFGGIGLLLSFVIETHMSKNKNR